MRYHDPNADKMETKSREGIFLTYGPSNSVYVMDRAEFEDSSILVYQGMICCICGRSTLCIVCIMAFDTLQSVYMRV